MKVLLYLFIALISVVLWILVLTNCIKRGRLLPERSRLRRARWGLMEIFVIGLVYVFLPDLLITTYLDWNPAVQVAINDMQADSDDSVILNPPVNPSSSSAGSDTDTDTGSENAKNPENDTERTDLEKAREADSNADETANADKNTKSDGDTNKDGSEETAGDENAENRKPKIYTKEADDEFLKQLLEESKKQEAEQEKAAKEKEQEENATESNAMEEPQEKKTAESTASMETPVSKTEKDSNTKDSSVEDANSKTFESNESDLDDSDANETASDEEITEDIGEESSEKSGAKKVEKGPKTTPSYAIDNPLEDMQEISVVNPLDIAYSASSDTGGRVPVEDPLGERGEENDSLEDTPNSQSQPGNVATPNQHELKQHPLIEMLNADPKSFWFLLFFAALLVPLTEEFIFRLILQGGLEAYERVHFATQWHSRSTQRNSGWRAMLAVALFFAFLHYRPVDSVTPTVLEMKINTYGTAISYGILLVFGVFLLRVSTTATWRDIGLDFSHWLTDLKLGALAFLLFILPTDILQACLPWWFNNAFVPDPISLIPVAIGFGILYWHTRRLLPSVFAHMLLNGSSMLLSLWDL